MSFRTFPIYIFFLVFTANLFAQPIEEGIYRASYGIFGDLSLNQHSANFQHLPGVPSCCPRYEKGTGTGPAFGGLYQLPLIDRFDFQLRVLYHSLSGTLSGTEPVTVFHNGAPVQGAFQHTLDTKLSTINIEPMLGIRVIGNLRASFGLEAGLLLSKTYAQQEEIAEPAGSGTFLDSLGNDSRQRIRNQLSGTIPNSTSLQLAVLGGISYALPLNARHTVFLVPEIFYSFGITRIASDLVWKVNSLRLGTAIIFSPKEIRREEKREIDTIRIERKNSIAFSVIPGKEIYSEEPEERDGIEYITEYIRRTDTLLIRKTPVLEASVAAAGIDANGNELPMVRMTVEEFSSTIMTPLLNYVFFDENSSEIPQRYNRLSNSGIDTFSIEHIHSSAKLGTYHHLLNIIALRLRKNPEATITVTGCNQNIRNEKNNLDLSGKRAEAVKKYFTDVWHIPETRMKIESRNLSAKAANIGTEDANEENRRVEITSSDPKVLFPVITDDTLRISNPPSVRFKPQTMSEAGIASWKLTAMQDGKLLKQFEGNANLPPSLDWILESSSMPRFSGEIRYTLAVKNTEGSSAEAARSIPVEQITIKKKREERRGDTVINHFSLILFDVGSSQITSSNTPIVSLIKEYIKPLSDISVTGFTDRLGDAVYNQKLAERRAATIAASLGTKHVSSKGIGQADLYESSLPEGRLYTRTVDVVIETPIEK